jgi:CBS domain-containing protein
MEPPDRLLGIVTERDLMTRVLAKALEPKHTSLAQVMTPQPHCVPPETVVSDALVAMLERGFRHLPIVGADRKILGVFSIRDALPLELGAALSQAEFNEQVNDALG